MTVQGQERAPLLYRPLLAAKRPIRATRPVDIEKSPYIEVFPRSLTSIEVWKAVKIMRAVDDELHKLQSVDLPRAYLIAIHFNRAILHLVFRDARPCCTDRSFGGEEWTV